MQLTNSSRLALAAAGLLGAANVSSVSAEEWTHEASVLYYGESDDRVTDGSLKYQGIRTNDDDNSLTLNLGVDSLTGASPSGVAPSGTVQILTSPSGKGTTTYPANQLTLDDTFKDTRVSGSANWSQSALGENTKVNVGGSFSKEYDYLHLGISAGLARELNNKNTTISVGLAYSGDTVEAVGNAPIPFSDQTAAKGSDSESKDTLDLMFGLTQVISKDTILQLNYGLSDSDGYLNDPYKWVSRVDASGSIVENLHESRPDSRTGHNVYASLKHSVSDNKVLTTSARAYTDDWGIDSYTLDAKFRVGLSDNTSIEPHFRYYHQSEADFYVPQLNAADNLPNFASADYRLAEFDAYTVGATYRWGNDKKWRLTGELYTQDPASTTLTEGQAGLDANPGFDAVMFSVGVKF
jgi:hypothetical protein